MAERAITSPISERTMFMTQRARKPAARWFTRTLAAMRYLRLIAATIFFILAVIAVGVAASHVTYGQGPGSKSATGGPPISKGEAMARAWCGVPGKPACPPPPDGWVPLRSEAPADVLAAAESTIDYQSEITANDPAGQGMRMGTPATPVLVKPYRSDVNLPEEWLIPVVNHAGTPIVMMEFDYDPVRYRLGPGGFGAMGGDPFYATHPFPAVSADAAIAAVQRERHVALLPGYGPELIYFPPDHLGFIMGKNNWASGGTAPLDPIWRVPGTDGRWYYVDHDGHSHLGSEIPVSPNYPPMPVMISDH